MLREDAALDAVAEVARRAAVTTPNEIPKTEQKKTVKAEMSKAETEEAEKQLEQEGFLKIIREGEGQ